MTEQAIVLLAIGILAVAAWLALHSGFGGRVGAAICLTAALTLGLWAGSYGQTPDFVPPENIQRTYTTPGGKDVKIEIVDQDFQPVGCEGSPVWACVTEVINGMPCVLKVCVSSGKPLSQMDVRNVYCKPGT